MADNTTTYRAVVDVDTKGTDQLEKLNQVKYMHSNLKKKYFNNSKLIQKNLKK